MNCNFKDGRGVVHSMNVRILVTGYNASVWRAWCSVELISATPTKAEVDCMTCLVNAARRMITQ